MPARWIDIVNRLSPIERSDGSQTDGDRLVDRDDLRDLGTSEKRIHSEGEGDDMVGEES